MDRYNLDNHNVDSDRDEEEKQNENSKLNCSVSLKKILYYIFWAMISKWAIYNCKKIEISTSFDYFLLFAIYLSCFKIQYSIVLFSVKLITILIS